MATKPTVEVCTAIRAELARITASERFDASERNRRFLNYIVEETLEGRADRIKAYSVATSVFGRSDDFDPQFDPVVRIEAHRLRRSIDYYYLTAGKEDPVRISVPKGGYVPSFEMPEHPETAEALQTPEGAAAPSFATPPRGSRTAPTILVAPFECDSDQTSSTLTRGFARQLIAGLTKFQDLTVLGPDTSCAYEAASRTERCEILKEVDLVVTGSITVSGDRFRAEAMLVEAREDRVIWAETFDRSLDPSSLVAVRDDVANCIVRTLAQSYGVILSSKANEVEGAAAEELGSYSCVALYYRYSSSYDARLYDKVRSCLESTVAREPNYAEAFACLSQIYSDGFRFKFGPAAGDEGWRLKALHLAQRAIALAPRSSRSFHALAVAYWFLNDVPSSVEAYETARALNPNATEIMADLGLRYAVLADWKKAVPLLEESYRRIRRNPAPTGWASACIISTMAAMRKPCRRPGKSTRRTSPTDPSAKRLPWRVSGASGRPPPRSGTSSRSIRSMRAGWRMILPPAMCIPRSPRRSSRRCARPE